MKAPPDAERNQEGLFHYFIYLIRHLVRHNGDFRFSAVFIDFNLNLHLLTSFPQLQYKNIEKQSLLLPDRWLSFDHRWYFVKKDVCVPSSANLVLYCFANERPMVTYSNEHFLRQIFRKYKNLTVFCETTANMPQCPCTAPNTFRCCTGALVISEMGDG